MIKTFLICIVLVLPHVAHAQIDTTKYIFRTDSVGIDAVWDSLGHHASNYGMAIQYFEYFAAGAELGELELLHQNGDTTRLFFDHPLSGESYSPEMLVYTVGTTSIGYPIHTQAFQLTQSDTLSYWFDALMTFPYSNPVDSSLITHAEDTTNFCIPDSVGFFVQIVDYSTNEAVAEVAYRRYLPTNNFYQLLDCIEPNLAIDENDVPFHWVAPDSLCTPGALYRIRLYPVYYPQNYGDYDDRSLYCRFTWGRKKSSFLKWMADTLRGMAKNTANRLAGGKAIEMTPGTGLQVYPTVFNQYIKSSLSIEMESPLKGNVTYVFLSMAGREIYRGIIPEESVHHGIATVPVPTHSMVPGTYIFTLNDKHHVYYRTIIVR